MSGPICSEGCPHVPHDPTCSVVRALNRALDALADCVVKATEFGEQDGGFIASYIMPTGPLHRAIPLLQEYGITVRPGFDGRTAAVPSPSTPTGEGTDTP